MDPTPYQTCLHTQLAIGELRPLACGQPVQEEILEEPEALSKPTYDQMHMLLEGRKPRGFANTRIQQQGSFVQRQLEVSSRHHYERTHFDQSVYASRDADGVCLSAASRAV